MGEWKSLPCSACGRSDHDGDAVERRLDDALVALGEAEAWITRYAHERNLATARAERAEAEATRLRALADDPTTNPYWRLRTARAEATIQRVRRLAELWRDEELPGAEDILAALDSTDPVEAAPEQDAARAAGYADAVAKLRDDERYRNWWSGNGAWQHKSTGRYWDATARGHLADYLETVGPDAQRPEERSDEGPKKAVILCELPVDGDWCTQPIGHKGPCDTFLAPRLERK